MAIVLPIAEVDRATQLLIDGYQRDFPLVSRPFAEIGERIALSEAAVIERLAALSARGAVSRVGAVVRPHTAGRSTLAAVAAPSERIEEVAATINAFAGVNHNYERENVWNLWFVVTCRTQADVDATLAGVAAATGLRVLDLPLETSFHIDLGFALFDTPRKKRSQPALRGEADENDRRLLAAIEGGLALTPLPYAAAAQAAGMSEAEVLTRLDAMVTRGVITRFGVVVRHRAFGYVANAMTVWDIDDADVDAVGEAFAREPGVTLCYRRPRRPPDWRYNLFTMIHGRDRAEALSVVKQLAVRAGGHARAHDVLFSLRCFKQRGAVFSQSEAAE
jgi:DNA-binding Lrp family transcriptional regulator